MSLGENVWRVSGHRWKGRGVGGLAPGLGPWRFRCCMLQTVAKSALDPRCPGQRKCVVQVSTTRRPVHTLKTVKGLFLLVLSRTPRNSGYDVYIHVVYVIICYMPLICICLLYIVICCMSVICYMSVICLVLGSSCYMYMSVICC